MEDPSATAATLTCSTCGTMGLVDGGDGFFYCGVCGSQAQDIIETGVADEDFIDKGGCYDARSALYSARYTRLQSTPKPNVDLSQSQSLYKTLSQVAMDIEADTGNPLHLDHVGPTEPMDFGAGQPQGLTDEDYYEEVRMRYVLGLQLMIQYQCEALVNKFGVSPMICGISGSIWLRFIASTGIFDEGWADDAMFESEGQEGGKMQKGKTGHKEEPRNVLNQRMIVIWYRSLRKRISLSCSLAVSYLACHIAREAVLPTDIQRWTIEGKLAYLSAFVDIEKVIGNRTRTCPLSASSMFKPSKIVPVQKLECLAATIAKSIQLSLPPVNFYAIAYRYLSQLSLPVEKILPYAVRLYEWSIPPDLWLSTNEFRLPPRTCVMALLVVTIRIIYNINGFGNWEASFSNHVISSCEGKVTGIAGSETEECGSGDSDEDLSNDLNSVCRFKSEAPELLCSLEKNYAALKEKSGYSKDLLNYLQYCKDVVFDGLEPLFEDHVEKKMINQFWDFYLKNSKESGESAELSIGQKEKRETCGSDEVNNLHFEWKRSKKEEEKTHRLDDVALSGDGVSVGGGGSVQSSQATQVSGISDESSSSWREISVRLMKLDMEENRFCYIPPREYIKRPDYLHYARKRDHGLLTYVVHADYYILLRACAKAAEVDVRIMHLAVLKLEKRLAWFEKRIDHCSQKMFT